MTLQIDFTLYHQGDLLKVRAHLREDCLSEDGGGAERVEEIQLLPPIGLKMGARSRIIALPLPTEAELAAHDAAEEICRVAAALRGGRSPGVGLTPWPPWAPVVRIVPTATTAQLLTCVADCWSRAQEARHSADHPTGPSDSEVYRKEAPFGSER